jgi:citrate lyase subunit beta / citryl-CoA lyase
MQGGTLAPLGIAGNAGPTVRSDCLVTLELTNEGGLQIDLKSKVKALFGDTIIEDTRYALGFFGIKNARIVIEDSGALPFMLFARIEAAVKQVMTTDRDLLPEMLPQNLYKTERNRQRRSRLYLPGNSPKLMLNAGIHQPDGIILDLEDAVAPAKKYEARFMVRNALRAIDFYGAERMVRINQAPLGFEDLEYVIPHNVNLILLPKCEHGDQVRKLEAKVVEIQRRHGLTDPIWFMPIIESALGVINAPEIASASPRVASIAIGLEDYTADLGVQRTAEGRESFLARSQVAIAAHAAGVQAIDSVFSDFHNQEALKQVILESKSLGFEGMGCIHPLQIAVIHQNYAPDEKAVERAKAIVKAFYEAEEKGLGVVALGSKMIDAPVVKRALKTIDSAVAAGVLPADWRNQ